jgi:hypothetical protein
MRRKEERFFSRSVGDFRVGTFGDLTAERAELAENYVLLWLNPITTWFLKVLRSNKYTALLHFSVISAASAVNRSNQTKNRQKPL